MTINDPENVREKCIFCKVFYQFHGRYSDGTRKQRCPICRRFKPRDDYQLEVEKYNRKFAVALNLYVFEKLWVSQICDLLQLSHSGLTRRLRKAGVIRRTKEAKPKPKIIVYDSYYLPDMFRNFPKIAMITDITNETLGTIYIRRSLLITKNISAGIVTLKDIGLIMEEEGMWE